MTSSADTLIDTL